MPSAPLSAKIPLYEKLAIEMARQIEVGTFRPGERLPSVRELSSQRSLSITTVLQAYHLLEDQGILESRPQSGYFVTQQARLTAEPEISSPAPDPTQVSLSELTLMVLHDTHRPDLIQFGAGIAAPELLPTNRLRRIMLSIIRAGNSRENAVGKTEGCIELRLQVAQRSFQSGLNLSPEDIVITSGCSEAVYLSLQAICKPGDLVAIESPTYFGILQALEAQGLRALEIPTHPRTGISLDALRFAVENHPVRACLVITNFNNPLGSCMPDENKKELVDLLAAHDIPLIENDIFGELYFSQQRPGIAKAYDQKGLVLLCSSFSKDISPGYRLGWIAPGRFKARIEQLKMAINIGAPILPQLVVAEFLASGNYEHHLRSIRRAYAHKVGAMAQAIIRYFPKDTRVTDPGGGFVLWVQLDKKVDSLELYKLALSSGISLAPGYLFSATPRYYNFIRLNAAFWSEKSEPALKLLGQIVAELAGK